MRPRLTLRYCVVLVGVSCGARLRGLGQVDCGFWGILWGPPARLGQVDDGSLVTNPDRARGKAEMAVSSLGASRDAHRRKTNENETTRLLLLLLNAFLLCTYGDWLI